MRAGLRRCVVAILAILAWLGTTVPALAQPAATTPGGTLIPLAQCGSTGTLHPLEPVTPEEAAAPTPDDQCRVQAALAGHAVVTLAGGTPRQFGRLLGLGIPDAHVGFVQRAVRGAGAGLRWGPPPPQPPDPAAVLADQGVAATYLAAHVEPSGVFDLYEGFAAATDQARQDAAAHFAAWTAGVQKGPADPAYPPAPVSPLYVLVMHAHIVWTDGNDWTYTYDGWIYRLSEASGGGDSYTMVGDIDAANDNPPAANCPFASGANQNADSCGPLLWDLNTGFAGPATAGTQMSNLQPGAAIPTCAESYTQTAGMTSSLGAGVSGGSGTASAQLGVQFGQSNGDSCTSPIVDISPTVSGNNVAWDASFNGMWQGPPAPQPTVPDVQDRDFGLVTSVDYQVPEGTAAIQGYLTGGGSTELHDSDPSPATTCGNWATTSGTGISGNYLDCAWYSGFDIGYEAAAPVFTVGTTNLQVCGPSSPNFAATQTQQVPVVNYIPSPGAQGGPIQQGTSSHAQGNEVTYSDTGWQPVGAPPIFDAAAPSYTWLPTQYSSSDVQFGPAGWSTQGGQSGPLTVYVQPTIPNNSTTSFTLTTNPTSAAPSEDAQSNPNADNTPNGWVVQVTTWGVPTVTGVSPGAAPPGTAVTVTGTGFMPNSAVYFGSDLDPASEGQVLGVNAQGTSISVVPPTGDGTVPVRVQTPCGTSSASGDPPPSAPLITLPGPVHIRLPSSDLYTFWPDVWANAAAGASSPTSAVYPLGDFTSSGGGRVLVTGSGFSGATQVSFGAQRAGTIVSIDPSGDSLVAVAPPYVGVCASVDVADVTVTTSVGTSPTNSAGVLYYGPGSGPCPSHVLLPCATTCFNDLAGYDWAGGWVRQVAHPYRSLPPIFVGVGPEAFDPGGTVTRAQFATVLWRMFGLAQPAQPIAFSDEQTGDWSYRAAEAAAADMDVFAGSAGLAFAPNAAFDRQHAAVAIVRALAAAGKLQVLGEADAEAVLAQFSDAGAITPALAPLVATAVRAGIMSGFPDGTFQPQATLDRAQLATVVARVESGFGLGGG